MLESNEILRQETLKCAAEYTLLLLRSYIANCSNFCNFYLFKCLCTHRRRCRPIEYCTRLTLLLCNSLGQSGTKRTKKVFPQRTAQPFFPILMTMNILKLCPLYLPTPRLLQILGAMRGLGRECQLLPLMTNWGPIVSQEGMNVNDLLNTINYFAVCTVTRQ